MPATKKILLVDDDPEICSILDFAFSQVGFETRSAYGVSAAIFLLELEKFDLVLSDIRMPEGGGMQLLNDIKKKFIPAPLVFLMTGFLEFPIEEALKEGAEGVFFKPFTFHEIIEAINSALAKPPC